MLPHNDTWTKFLPNKIGRMEQGMGTHIKGTNTTFFIHRSAVSAGKMVTHGKIFVSITPKKAKTHRV